MTDRNVKVTLTAQVAGYISGMEQAAKKTKQLGEGAEDVTKKMQATQAAMGTVGTGFTVVGAVATAALAIAVSKMAEFESALSSVKAATQETTANMDLLREAALDAGARTSFTATEAANAIEELGKAGLSTSDILSGGLDGALSLAAAGNIGVADAAGFAAIAMKQFGLEGSQIPHVADLLAAGAGKAVGDVDDLAQALNQAGLVANGAGFSIEETTGVLAAFADAGLLGSDAGTSLKTAIIALQNPSAKAAAELDKYGLSVYDANGNMLGFSEIAGQLETKLGGVDAQTRNAALATIFGNDALRAANVLYTQGADGIAGYIKQTNDGGYAAKVAADRLNNLAGDVEKLGGSFDTALIRSGSAANDVLRQLTQSATFLVDGIGGLPAPVLAVGLALGTATVAILLVGGTALMAAPKIAAFKLTLDAAGISGKTFALRTAAMGGALGLATMAVGYFVSRAADAAATTAELTDSLDKATGAFTDYSREIVRKKLAESGAYDSAKQLGISQRELTDAVFEGGDALDKFKAKLTGKNNVVDFFNGSGIAASNARDTIQVLSDGVVRSKVDFENQKEAIDGSTTSTSTAADAYSNAAGEVETLQDNLATLIETINKANGVGQDAVSTNAAYQSGLADVTAYIDQARKGVEGFTLGWAANTVEGSANREMLSGLAQDSQAAATAQLALDGNTEAYMATMVAGNKLMYDQAIAFGATTDEAHAFADQVYAIPTAHETKLIAETAGATRSVDDFIARMGQKVGVINFRANLPDLNGISVSGNGRMGTFADGGAIGGVGGPRQDNVPIMASVGEHVLDAGDVARMGGQAGVYAFRKSLYTRSGYADGGAVRPTYASSASAGATAVNVSPMVSLAGATLLMTVDGRQMTAFVQDQIVGADHSNSLTDRMGVQ
jgi:TP901 family phage tail tape measure protein